MQTHTEVQEHIETKRKTWAELSESAKQSLCGYYVGREVQQCVSSLVSSVLGVANQYCEVDSELDTETLSEGFTGYDYQEAAEAHINDCSDPDDLISMAEGLDCEDELMEAAGYDENNPPVETPADPDDPDSEDEMCASFDDFFYMMKAADQEDPILEAMRKVIIENLPTNPDEFCNKFDIDYYDYPREVYEYWLVSDWMGRHLSERGYLVVEWMNMTVWGRQCSGQSISLDCVIRYICGELYDNGYYFPDNLVERYSNE